MIRQEASGSEVTGDALAQRVETMLDEQGGRMTPAALLQWAGDADGPADEDAMAAHAGKPPGTAQKGQPD